MPDVSPDRFKLHTVRCPYIGCTYRSPLTQKMEKIIKAHSIVYLIPLNVKQ